MKVYKLSTEEFAGMCVDSVDALLDMIRAELTEESTSEPGTELHIEVLEMTRVDLEALPEV